jgi:phosphatidylinositol alpha-mannosyltransferase
MACETPVVCSDILGFRDVVEHEREALMVPCGDQRALADSLVRILDDPGLGMRLATTGRQNSLSYSWARVTSQVLDVYRSVLGHVAEEVA